jgi:hypothetical protein
MTKSVMEEIEAERKRQIEVEGWSAEHDDKHTDCDLIDAARCYMTNALGSAVPTRGYDHAPVGWPWEQEWWKPKDARRDLIRAGALCLADQDYWRRNYPESPPQELPKQMIDRIIAEITKLDRYAQLRPALCPPRQRIEGVDEAQWIRMIKWHERQAEIAMNSLHCGSENWEYRVAGDAADAHWCAAALMRLHIGRSE